MPGSPTPPVRRPWIVGAAMVVVLAVMLGVVALVGGVDAGSAGEKGAGSAGGEDAGSAAPALVLEPVGRFEAPTHIAAPPGDPRRLLVVERDGRAWMLRDGRRVPGGPFLDLTGRVDAVSESGERGLLSVAFAPDHARSRLLYAAYTGADGALRVDELRAGSGGRRAIRTRTIIRVPHPSYDNHNGGQIAFGPDGMLWVGTGDGGGAWDPWRAGQDPSSLLAKLLRIDPRPGDDAPYRIPDGNPFAGRPGARPEIAVTGARNPWRFSFDRATGDLLVADVGQDEREEVTFLPGDDRLGANLGWSCFEGTKRLHDCPAPDHRPPALERTHDDGECSITGGHVVRDRALPALEGRYVYGDFCTGRVRSAVIGPDGASDDRLERISVPLLASFGEDARGGIYAASLDGPVYRVRQR